MLVAERLEIVEKEKASMKISRTPPLPTRRNLKRDTI